MDMAKKLFGLTRTSEGRSFEGRVQSALKSARNMVFPSKDNSQNSSGKKSVR